MKSRFKIEYKCSECGYPKISYDEYRIEPHNYEQMYYQDGKVQSICVGCHDSFYW